MMHRMGKDSLHILILHRAEILYKYYKYVEFCLDIKNLTNRTCCVIIIKQSARECRPLR